MADPKYAGLPGIDASQDCYESGDLPEEDQRPYLEELQSESVEVDVIDTTKSFSKFNPKYLSGDNVDFSDRIKKRADIGYDIGLSDDKNNETPTERLQRLKIEVVELHENINKLSKDKAQGDSSAVELLNEVENLKSQLNAGNISQKVSEINRFSNTYNKLNTVVDSLKTANKSKPSSQTFASYNLVVRPGDEQQKNTTKLSQIEQRLANIEKVIGYKSSDLNVLTNSTETETLQAAIENLEAKLSLLDPNKLPQVDTRLQAVLNKLLEINKAKKQPGVESDEMNKKIESIYNSIEKWSSFTDVLPSIVDRLEALDILHKQASQFSETLNSMETLQTEISTKLINSSAVQKELSKSFEENTKVIHENISALEKRIGKLGK